VQLGFVDSFASTAGPGLIKRLLDKLPLVRLLAWSGLAPAQGEALLRRRPAWCMDRLVDADKLGRVEAGLLS